MKYFNIWSKVWHVTPLWRSDFHMPPTPRLPLMNSIRGIRDRLFSAFANFSDKLTFFTPWYAHVTTCAYKGVINVSFSENSAYELNELSLRMNETIVLITFKTIWSKILLKGTIQLFLYLLQFSNQLSTFIAWNAYLKHLY